MAVQRPWITPSDVKGYSDDIAIIGKKETVTKDGQTVEKVIVPERTDAKLLIDIARAEAMIIGYCHHDFSNAEKYPQLPNNVRVAAILLTEAIAHNGYITNAAYSNYKSETFDDYSYTAGDTSAVSISGLNLSSLLDEYVESKQKGDVIFRLRKL